jgi:two-component system response regulator AtoC
MGGIELLVPDRSEPSALPELSAARGGEHFHGMLSGDDAMRAIFRAIVNVAETSASVLVRGASGTGKELVARAVHAESARADGPFVAVNCAALTPSLMESELFGHVRGAFTGAERERRGLFEQAHTGTLFLDEVAELPLQVQAKLLRVLEQRVVVRVGDGSERPVDVRIISATHRSLRSEVAAGRFREDLLFRLRVVPLYLPPLRERRGDVEALLWHFIGQLNVIGPRVVDRVAPAAMRSLLDHDWPGNVRELRNVLQYAFAVGRGAELTRGDLPPEMREASSLAPARAPAVAGIGDEKRRIEHAIADAGGHLGEAARALGVSRPTLWRKRRKYGM